jgi:hypothetical protein
MRPTLAGLGLLTAADTKGNAGATRTPIDGMGKAHFPPWSFALHITQNSQDGG